MRPSTLPGLSLVFAAVGLIPAWSPAQDPAPAPTLTSGPPQGRRLTVLRVVDVTGPQAGQERDASAQLQRGPAAILFVHEVTRNVAPVIRAFDQVGAELLPLGLQVLCVRLSGDRTQAEQHTPLVVQSLRMRAPMVVSADGAEGPGNYALNRKAALTLVLARDGVVRDSFAFGDTGQNDAPFLRLCLEGLAGSMPEAPDQLTAALAAAAPTDRGELVALLVRLELDRRRLQAQLAELDRRLAEQRGGRGMAMDAPRDEAADRAGDAMVALVRRLGRAEAAADEVAAALTELERLLQARPGQRTRARELLQRVAEADHTGAVARQQIRAWLDRDGR